LQAKKIAPNAEVTEIFQPSAGIFLKTKMCRFHLLDMCSKGNDCPFAHTVEEMKPLPDLHCTKLCKALILTGECTDPQCTYAHSRGELRNSGLPHRPQPASAAAGKRTPRAGQGASPAQSPAPLVGALEEAAAGDAGAAPGPGPQAPPVLPGRCGAESPCSAVGLGDGGEARGLAGALGAAGSALPLAGSVAGSAPPPPAGIGVDLAELLSSGDVTVKNTFLEFGPREPAKGLRMVHSASGRLDLLAGEE